MEIGVGVLVVAVLAATAFGLWRRRVDGRLKQPSSAVERLTAVDLRAPLGERATLVHFSSAFCQPCVAARRVLGEVAAMVPGTSHVEVDAESNLDLVRHLAVMRTPTVLVLDRDGVIVRRASGAPRKADVIAALGAAIPAEA
ncbi:MAG: thioredoxin family protein [Candidatus Nanopelagicales bacterium]